MIWEDIDNDTRVPWYKRLKWYMQGFNSDRYYMYEFDKNNPKDYLPDLYKRRTIKLDGKYAILLNDKKLFDHMTRDIIPSNILYGEIIDKKIYIDHKLSDHENLKELLYEKRDLIVKRRSDGGGKGVYWLSYHEDQIMVDRVNVSIDEFLLSLDFRHEYLITEYIRQADYANKIFPYTSNTIRVQTMRDPDNGEVFISLAVHKFGTKASIPTDNQSKGGIVAAVDIETGIIGRPCNYTNIERLTYYDVHPDTHEVIEGVRIPKWKEITDEIIGYAEKLDYLPYIGWDIVVTNSGVRVIEGNSHTGIGLQMFQPFYANKRAKRFFDVYFEKTL